MADNDVLVAEVEADPIEPNNRIADLLKAIETDNHVEAEKTFTDLLGDRLGDALDQRKVSLAQDTFNGSVEAEEEEIELSDEEISAELESDEEETSED